MKKNGAILPQHDGNELTLASVTFLYPSRVIGGAQLLFVRLAIALAASGKARVTVVDYQDGFLWRELQNLPGIRLLAFQERVTSLRDTTVIMPLSHLVELRYMLDRRSIDTCDFLFWSIHPDNVRHLFYSYARHWFGRKKTARELLRQCATDGQIVLMDQANQFAFESEVGQCGSTSFLPIPILAAEGQREGQRQREDGRFQIAWLGRISYDKINSILKIVDDLSRSRHRDDIVLHVIGNGTEEAKLHAHVQRSGIRVEWIGVLQGADLIRYLLDRADMGIAMGTSALDIASLGIPVALIDYSMDPLPNNQGYDWLYDTKNFTLGNDAAWKQLRALQFDQLIDQLKSDPANDIGKRCLDYVRRNHGMSQVLMRLQEFISKTSTQPRGMVARLDDILNPPVHSVIYAGLRSARARLRRLKRWQS